MIIKSPPTDPLTALVEGAVRRALEEFLPKLAAIIPPPPAPATPPLLDLGPERFVPLSEATELFGAHRTTLLRYELQAKLPRRKRFGVKTGWLLSELTAALAQLPENPRAVSVRRRRAS